MTAAPLRATFLVPYPPDSVGGQRFRFEQWLSLLGESAIEARIVPLFSPGAYSSLYRRGHLARKTASTMWGAAKRILTTASLRNTDVVYVYRELFPLGPPALEMLLERRLPVVFDFDDAIYLPSTSEANRIIRPLKRTEKVDRTVAHAAATTVGNEHLARYARQYSEDVFVIPTTIDVDRYAPEPHRGGRSSTPVRIGWSGSPTTSPHLRHIEGALRRVLTENEAELVVLGDPEFSLPDVPNVSVRRWTREGEISEVGAFDIGLMPLPDDEWTRGKCGFKALLYMSLGVPAIVSPVGVNTEIVDHGVNGLIASAENDWIEAITRLIRDVELRRTLGDAGRRTVIDRYSGQEWAPKFLDVLTYAAQKAP